MIYFQTGVAPHRRSGFLHLGRRFFVYLYLTLNMKWLICFIPCFCTQLVLSQSYVDSILIIYEQISFDSLSEGEEEKLNLANE